MGWGKIQGVGADSVQIVCGKVGVGVGHVADWGCPCAIHGGTGVAAVLPFQMGIGHSFEERFPVLMEISKATPPRAFVTLVSRAVRM